MDTRIRGKQLIADDDKKDNTIGRQAKRSKQSKNFIFCTTISRMRIESERAEYENMIKRCDIKKGAANLMC